MAARSAAGVSPVRTATDRSGAGRPEPLRLVGDARQRELQVLVDVGGERPERRDVDDAGPDRGGPASDGAGRPGPGRRRRWPPGSRSVSCRCRSARRRGRPRRPRCGATPAAGARSGPAGKRRRNQRGHRRVEGPQDRVLREVAEADRSSGLGRGARARPTQERGSGSARRFGWALTSPSTLRVCHRRRSRGDVSDSSAPDRARSSKGASRSRTACLRPTSPARAVKARASRTGGPRRR